MLWGTVHLSLHTRLHVWASGRPALLQTLGTRSFCLPPRAELPSREMRNPARPLCIECFLLTRREPGNVLHGAAPLNLLRPHHRSEDGLPGPPPAATSSGVTPSPHEVTSRQDPDWRSGQIHLPNSGMKARVPSFSSLSHRGEALEDSRLPQGGEATLGRPHPSPKTQA